MAFEPVTLASLPVDGRKTRRHLTAEQRAEHSRIAAAKWRAKHPDRDMSEYMREWHATHPTSKQTPAYFKAHHLRKSYNLSVDDYNQMVKSQLGVCAACGKPETRTRNGIVLGLVVDHNHTTGKVRGLLCQSCNIAIGMTNDDISVLAKIIAYLSK